MFTLFPSDTNLFFQLSQFGPESFVFSEAVLVFVSGLSEVFLQFFFPLESLILLLIMFLSLLLDLLVEGGDFLVEQFDSTDFVFSRTCCPDFPGQPQIPFQPNDFFLVVPVGLLEFSDLLLQLPDALVAFLEIQLHHFH